jgi:hypothetical protein
MLINIRVIDYEKFLHTAVSYERFSQNILTYSVELIQLNAASGVPEKTKILSKISLTNPVETNRDKNGPR